MRSSCNCGTRPSWQTMNSGSPCSRAPQSVVGAWQLGTTALPFDFPTRRAIGFQQSGEAGTFPLTAGRSVIAVLVLTPSLGTRCIRWPTAGNGLSQNHRLYGRRDLLAAA